MLADLYHDVGAEYAYQRLFMREKKDGFIVEEACDRRFRAQAGNDDPCWRPPIERIGQDGDFRLDRRRGRLAEFSGATYGDEENRPDDEGQKH
jgi:hypothetical protein